MTDALITLPPRDLNETVACAVSVIRYDPNTGERLAVFVNRLVVANCPRRTLVMQYEDGMVVHSEILEPDIRGDESVALFQLRDTGAPFSVIKFLLP